MFWSDDVIYLRNDIFPIKYAISHSKELTLQIFLSDWTTEFVEKLVEYGVIG